MYELKIRYKALTDFIGAITLASGMVSAITDSARNMPVPALEKKVAGRSVDEILDIASKAQDRATRAVKTFSVAMGQAGIFPEYHPMATAPDDVITLKLTEAAILELIAVAQGNCVGLRGVVNSIKGGSTLKGGALSGDMIFGMPLEQLTKATPEFIRAVLDAGAPIF